MIAIDTNVLVRYLTNDTPRLAAIARRLIQDEECYVSRPVLLETFQVLESFYALSREALLRTMKGILAIEGITVEKGAESAIEWYEAGMDFADALVLSSAHGHNTVATFDRNFAKIARKLKTKPEVLYRG